MVNSTKWVPPCPIDLSTLEPNFSVRWNDDIDEWEIYQYQFPESIIEPTPEEIAQAKMELCKGRREYLLSSSDFVFGPDSPVDPTTLDDWKAYRQALRDLTNTDPNWGDADLVIWPPQPIYKTI